MKELVQGTIYETRQISLVYVVVLAVLLLRITYVIFVYCKDGRTAHARDASSYPSETILWIKLLVSVQFFSYQDGDNTHNVSRLIRFSSSW